MLFNSFSFIVGFLPAALLAYWSVRRLIGSVQAILMLAVASYLFYLLGEPNYPWLLVLSIAFNYACGLLITRASGSGRRTMLAAGIAGNLSALAYFKYFNFLVDNVLHFSGSEISFARIALPLGISFFTFTQIAYLVDVYRRAAIDRDLLRYFLFVAFFPHLIAGPILHHQEMMPQFADLKPRTIVEDLATGLPMFAIGLFKKCVIADSVASTATGFFASAAHGKGLTLLPAWLGVLAYTVQIYFDFSGYSDMAIGLGRLFGIDLPVNFNSPYKAVSIVDFWRRWHITLSRLLRDYLYIPLGGNRHGSARRYLNLFLTMLLGGIWHGAGWTFAVWGALHGAYLMLCAGFGTLRARWGVPALPRFIAATLTFAVVVFAWVPFRAPTIAGTREIWRAMLGLNGWLPPGLSVHSQVYAGILEDRATLLVFVGLLASWLLPNSQQLLASFRLGLDSPGYFAIPSGPSNYFVALRRNAIGAIAIGLLLGIALRSIGSYSEFIYFHF